MVHLVVIQDTKFKFTGNETTFNSIKTRITPTQFGFSDFISLSSTSFSAAGNYMLSANNILDYAIITCGGAISNSLGLVFLLFHIAKTYEEYGHPVSRSRTLYFFDDATSMKTIFFGLCCVLNTALLITYFNTIDYEGEDKDPNETNTVSTHSILAVLAIAFLMSLARRLKQNILYIL